MLRDRAALAILASNLLTLVVASWQGWGLLWMLWPYWIQSVVIGYFSYRRIRVLQRFGTEGLLMNDRPVPRTPSGRDQVARFFALHFGLFHFVYLIFLLVFSLFDEVSADGNPVDTGMGRLGEWDPVLLLALGLSFVFSHAASHRRHVAADLAGRPDLGTLMFLPYARVVPMHLMIIVGTTVGSGTGIWLFGALKTAADLLMHWVEHRVLQKRPAPR